MATHSSDTRLSKALLVRILLVSSLNLLFNACGALPDRSGFLTPKDGAPRHKVDMASIADAIPRVEPRSRYGNPDSYVVNGQRYHVMADNQGYTARGVASWYGTKFHGRKTSSGDPYDMFAMTAAHKTLPLPTYLEVTNLDNGRKIIVKANDRGPFLDNRLIDLSYAAAVKLDVIKTGTAHVEIRAIDPATYNKPTIQKQTTAVTGLPPPTTASQNVVAAITTGLPSQPGSEISSTLPTAIFIQVAAFSDRLNAERLRNRLTHVTNATIEIKSTSDKQRNLYRVSLGPFPSQAEADRVAEKIAALGLDLSPNPNPSLQPPQRYID